jgi:hypothetical protein
VGGSREFRRRYAYKGISITVLRAVVIYSVAPGHGSTSYGYRILHSATTASVKHMVAARPTLKLSKLALFGPNKFATPNEI